MTLNEIYYNNYLSARAYNVCGLSRIYNLELILDYYLKNHSFIQLRNCGETTDKELINFCETKLAEQRDIASKKGAKYLYLTLLDGLTSKRKEIVNNFIAINFDSLSVRSQNAVIVYLRGDIQVKNFVRMFLSSTFDGSKMKNVGKKSIPEIEKFIQIIGQFIAEVHQVEDDDQLSILRNKLLVQKKFSINDIPNEILQSQSIFRLVRFLLDQHALFNKKQTKVLKKTFKIYDTPQEVNFATISAEMGCSRERIRQYKNNFIEQLPEKLSFLANFDDNLYTHYGIDINADYVFVDDALKEKINAHNSTKFSTEFLTFLIYCYLRKRFALVGNIDDVLPINFYKHRKRHHWKSFYPINLELSKIFSFERFVADIRARLHKKIEKTYVLDLKNYMSGFVENKDIGSLERIVPIVRKMVFTELHVVIGPGENILFNRNTKKWPNEYAFEALEQIGKPSKVKIITAKVRELHPEYEINESRIRVSMQRKNGFVFIGRKSVYGLKKWEKERDNFKGGTIRTITEEFLLKCRKPKHKREIARYVKQYRPGTSANSIYNNLYVDTTGKFVFYQNYYIGLSSKKYTDDFKILVKSEPSPKYSWAESYEKLKQFIEVNKRLPYSSTAPEKELKIYRWWSLQLRKAQKNALDQKQAEQIASIKNQYGFNKGKSRMKR